MQEFLKKLEETLKTYLKETYLPPHRAKTPGWTHHDLVFFARGADLLSTAFTEGRATLPKNYFNKKEFRSGFILYFFIPTFVKVWKCLEIGKDNGPFDKLRAQQWTTDSGQKTLKILDLGCGPGTASLACSAFFQNRPLEIFGFEQNANIRRDAIALWKRLAPPHHRFHFTKTPIPNEKIDIAIASYFFTEIPLKEQLELSREILRHSRIFIIIEPALQKTTRQLMELRDKILESGRAQVLAPCLHQQNCPMLAANKRDWCHFYIDWKCPYFIRQIDEITGNKHDYLKMAYMVFRGQRTTDNGQRTKNQWRVVSSPLISKGKREFILCGADGKLPKIERLDRDRSEQNRSFDEIKRGDIIEWPEKRRVDQKDAVTIVRKF